MMKKMKYKKKYIRKKPKSIVRLATPSEAKVIMKRYGLYNSINIFKNRKFNRSYQERKELAEDFTRAFMYGKLYLYN
jgi:hypothetical protein